MLSINNLWTGAKEYAIATCNISTILMKYTTCISGVYNNIMHDIAGSSPSVHGLGIQNKLALVNMAFKFCQGYGERGLPDMSFRVLIVSLLLTEECDELEDRRKKFLHRYSIIIVQC
jgi:hypothetical protein